MAGVFFTDTSYYQSVVNDSYPHPFISFRVSDGSFVDPYFSENYLWSKKSKVQGIIGYHVFRPSLSVDAQFQIISGAVNTPDARLAIMIDVESWGGQIGGNHSTEINALVNRLSNWLDSTKRVIAYGNRYDLESIYPDRFSNLKLVVASYGSIMPKMPNQIAWQYYGGVTSAIPSGFPINTSPFGHCDHNYSPLTAVQLAQTLGLSPTPVVSDPTNNLLEEYEMYRLYQVVHGPTAGRQYAVSSHSKPRWLTPTDKANLVRFGLFVNPNVPTGIEQVEIDRLTATIAKFN